MGHKHVFRCRHLVVFPSLYACQESRRRRRPQLASISASKDPFSSDALALHYHLQLDEIILTEPWRRCARN